MLTSKKPTRNVLFLVGHIFSKFQFIYNLISSIQALAAIVITAYASIIARRVHALMLMAIIGIH